ncbi:hypothetical protein Sipo8835_24155 [Streptomyces ipomoeae]|jgi:hypothetical protein|uniref:Uncharacterized protein n=2 Tax=Streptomyces ipomoeae TaxID=103232 RepID=L1KLY1_9ACTN|nr:DUF6082 family protein [Streptomyces ipomoeae]EKX61791.1 hypothetical protein STRIP9103_07386 [Streptomyces ipomoeae 91-03]MDX2692254.1 DUF6082 family protein [Streptomyces ipomoeae]MDX2819668.1 DUF6082 family protein [Streptomyces ipomoeae]MDX2838787.1 DUF6082 family protein [Streptomyces ipomoeae]MDX2872357.1 DUF6082 family protein [Streptomyces ipomoeae]
MATQSFGVRRLGSAVSKRLKAALTSVSAGRARQQRHAALTEQHRLHFDLLCKAMDDSALAAVLDTYESDVPAERQRQYLFANALYVNALYYHRIGAWSLTELYGHLRVICRNTLFREYWEATRHHRQSLPDSSEEAELGRMMDGLVREMDRLSQESDEGDLEEWWVVGQPPGE